MSETCLEEEKCREEKKKRSKIQKLSDCTTLGNNVADFFL